jgi:hypothetical protein
VVTTRTAGSSGTQIANCIFEGTGATLTPGEAPMQTSSAWTIDTTATKVIDLVATWSTATGAPTITSTNVAAWIPGAPVTSVNGMTGAVTVSGGGSSTSFGAYPAPATCTSGSTYFFNDNTLYTRADCTATNTETYLHNSAKMTLPPTCASLTWVNQNASGTCSNTQGALVMATNTPSCCSNQLLVAAVPSTPYSFTTEMIVSGPNGNSSSGSGAFGYNAGLAIYDTGSTKFSACEVYANQSSAGAGAAQFYTVRFEHWNSPTSDNATVAYVAVTSQVPIRLKIRDDGTNHYCYYSLDEGLHFSELLQESRTVFVPSGGNRVGFVQLFWNMLSVDTAYINFLDYTQGT